MTETKWQRVTAKEPCRICLKSDWCGFEPSSGWACCMRLHSARPAKNGGWLHRLDEEVRRTLPVRRPEPIRPTINAAAIMAGFKAQTTPYRICALSDALDVDSGALVALGVAWAEQYHAYCFPMKDGAGRVVGIRLRDENGRKWAVTGSKSGIFWPDMPAQDVAVITEGPTCLAAALSIGLFGLGRPSCNSGMAEILAALASLKVRRVIIVSDNDNKERPDGTPYSPGLEGALALQKEFTVPSCVFIPPTKDFRAFVNAGGTKELLDSSVAQLVWRKPKK